MKKLFCLFLTLIMVLTISSTCFAEEDINSEVDQIDLDAARTVNTETYKEKKSEKDLDGNDNTISPELVEIEEQVVPAGLPNTGGIPAEAFYVAGALFVVAALILALKKNKTGHEN